MNGGTGEFALGPTVVHQFSKLRITPSGTLTIEDKQYPVAGDAWFDRQWQKAPGDLDNLPMHWAWLDLNLENGDKASVWCVEMPEKHISRA